MKLTKQIRAVYVRPAFRLVDMDNALMEHTSVPQSPGDDPDNPPVITDPDDPYQELVKGNSSLWDDVW